NEGRGGRPGRRATGPNRGAGARTAWGRSLGGTTSGVVTVLVAGGPALVYLPLKHSQDSELRGKYRYERKAMRQYTDCGKTFGANEPVVGITAEGERPPGSPFCVQCALFAMGAKKIANVP